MSTAQEEILKGVALVTGAGGGLGRALATELAAQGMKVAGFGRREDALAETRALAGERFTGLQVDVADPKAVRAGFEEIRRIAGPVTVLLNNAAVYPRRDFLDETAESFAATVAVNLGGIVACTEAALEHMCETGVGRIVNVATFADVAPIPASAAYAVSKGAARVLTRALVADLGDRFPDIVIGDWMPGMLATPMGVPHGLAPETAARWGAALALWHDPSLNGAVFERDEELLPPRGLKRRVKDMLMFRRPSRPRQLGG